MRDIKLIKTLPFQVPEIIDITDQLPRNGSWEELEGKKWNVRGKWDGKTYHKGFRKESDINRIIIHHSASPEGTLQSHASYHARKWGAGIAYHIAIDNGRIYQLNDLLSMTYHAANNNTDSIGIMVNRDLTKKDLTDEERALLYAAILTVKSLFKIEETIGHNECCPTQCPATNMVRIRTEVGQIERQIEKASSLEQELDSTINASLAQVYTAYTRIAALYDLTKVEGPNRQEAIRKMLLVSDMMVQAGILKK